MKLFGYFRSSAAYRVRIALNLKALAVEHVSVHLVTDGGRQLLPENAARNPQRLVPSLELDDGRTIVQSIAIMEYLDTVTPLPPLVPKVPFHAAQVRAVSLAIACEIHPLNNLRVLNYLREPLGHSPADVDAWYRHWLMSGGLEPIEQMLPGDTFCFGDAPTMADCCLIPQLFNARRFKVSFEHLPKISRIEATCAKLEAFAAAHPSMQADSA